MKNSYNIAIVGATGIVGATTLSILEERQFPIHKLYLLASQRSTGETRTFKGKVHPIVDIASFDFSQTQICFFCVGNEIAAQYVPKAAALGNVVIDKSSYYRYDADVPLVIPEVNERTLTDFSKKNIVASPNCSTIPIVVALKPIYDAVGITRINIATYQSVSGSGKEGISELSEQTGQIINNKPTKPKVYSQQIAFNILPQIDSFEDNGYTREEMKVVWEMKKILADDALAINPTAVRVPVFYGHSAAVHVETKNKLTAKQAVQLLTRAPGVLLSSCPTPVQDAAGKDAVCVGRIREDLSHPNGLNLWIVSDNVRKGAALNAVQIAESLIKTYL